MAFLKISNSTHLVLVDESMANLLSFHNWSVQPEGYVVTQMGRYVISMHRYLLGLKKWDPSHVDHINMNKLDNRLSNLRVCTRSQNFCNRGPNSTNKTGYKGVVANGLKFQAKICLDRKVRSLGTYSSPIDAARAYDKAALQYHGEFARLNFPQGESA